METSKYFMIDVGRRVQIDLPYTPLESASRFTAVVTKINGDVFRYRRDDGQIDLSNACNMHWVSDVLFGSEGYTCIHRHPTNVYRTMSAQIMASRRSYETHKYKEVSAEEAWHIGSLPEAFGVEQRGGLLVGQFAGLMMFALSKCGQLTNFMREDPDFCTTPAAEVWDQQGCPGQVWSTPGWAVAVRQKTFFRWVKRNVGLLIYSDSEMASLLKKREQEAEASLLRDMESDMERNCDEVTYDLQLDNYEDDMEFPVVEDFDEE